MKEFPAYPLTPGRYLIEASAGTGKTYTITHLVLRLILQGIPVQEILVTTFSKAAAAELKARILKLLNDELDELRRQTRALETAESDPSAGEAPDDDAQMLLFPLGGETSAEPPGTGTAADAPEMTNKLYLLMQAVSSFDEMTVSTIHGFCQRMLRRFVLETRQDFELELIPDESKYRDRLVRAFCRNKFYGENDGGGLKPDFRKYQNAARFAEQEVDDCPVQDEDELISQYRMSGKRMPAPEYFRQQIAAREAYCYVRDNLQKAKDEDGVFTFNDMIRIFHEALDANPGLAGEIRSRYRAVFVDEFQDTDKLQYSIFDRCFPKDGNTVFYMIGDPKQAIYAFRGADIYTYLLAKHSATRSFDLDENFRSSPDMIRAVNRMFGDGRRSDSVFLQDGIPFIPVKPGRPPEAFPRNPGACVRLSRYAGSKGDCNKLIMRDVVRDVRDLLLNAGSMTISEEREVDGKKVPEGRPLRASDIAILVQTNHQAATFVSLLNREGIAASACKSGTIYSTPEAKVMHLLLEAFLTPGLKSARGLMLSPFFRCSCDEIVSAPVQVESVMKRLAECGAVWRKSGLPAAFLGFLDAPCADGVTPRVRVLSESNGERALTNYLHLMELLYQKEQDGHLQPEDVLNALNLAISGHGDDASADADSEDNPDQLRLDRDSASVQILTMFTAKGLEFPVVFVPFPSDKAIGHFVRKDAIAFLVNSASTGDTDSRITLDFGMSDSNRGIVQMEALRSSVRLLYVALTRATLVTYLYVQQLEKKGTSLSINFVKSAQGVLLRDKGFGPQDFLSYFLGTDDFQIDRPAEWYGSLFARDDAGAAGEQSAEHPMFELIRDCPASDRAAASERTGSDGLPSGAPDTAAMEALKPPAIPDDWRVMSFSAFHALLTDRAYKESDTSADYDENSGQDAAGDFGNENGTVTDGERKNANTFIDFPHGEKAGTLTHGILEDFASNTPDRGDAGITCYFNLFSERNEARNRDYIMACLKNRLKDQVFLPEDAPALYDGIKYALRTPLPGLGISLCSLPRDRMTAEMEFFLDASSSLDLNAILSIMKDSASEKAKTHSVEGQDIRFDKRGILNGIVDLIFEYGGKFYIVDWKTNWLGNGDAAYSPDRIAAAMGAAGYVLQSYLYAAGLLRMLRQRGLGDAAFGGVYYLFLRGLDGRSEHGIWHDAPPLPCLERLLNLFQGDGWK